MIIDPRYNGPPGSANGGYAAGLVAAALGAGRTGCVVMLRTPPPLATPLREAQGRVYAGEQLIAEAEPVEVTGEPPAPVGYEAAVAAAAAYPGFTHHPFPTCFVCGPERATGDGLRIFPGPADAGHGDTGHGDTSTAHTLRRTAAPWLVPDDVSPLLMWAALDCPGGWAVIAPDRTYLLGRLAAVVAQVPAPGTRCVAVGELVAAAGRKAQVRTAVYAADGTVPLAHAEATWITTR